MSFKCECQMQYHGSVSSVKTKDLAKVIHDYIWNEFFGIVEGPRVRDDVRSKTAEKIAELVLGEDMTKADRTEMFEMTYAITEAISAAYERGYEDAQKGKENMKELTRKGGCAAA